MVHLKVTYYDKEGRPSTININLDEAKRVKELIHKYVLAEGAEKGLGNTNMFGLDTREDEVRLILDGEFEFIHLDDNPAQSVKIGFRIPMGVSSTLSECL